MNADTNSGESETNAQAPFPSVLSQSGTRQILTARAVHERLRIRPMDAVAALYSEKDEDLAEAIFARLGEALFERADLRPSSLPRRLLGRINYRLLKRTTARREAGEGDFAQYRNRLLERSQHPYAHALMGSSSKETAALVEGGDPMNGPYMLIAPEIREACTLWDKLLLNSVQSRDVQLRFIWETRATFDEARHRLDLGLPVRMKALAAGTGLSMILAYDRLIRAGYDPSRITVSITDRDPSNTIKTGRLLSKLARYRGWKAGLSDGSGITAHTEDIFHGGSGHEKLDKHDLLTAVGILEYLQGHTLETTERRYGLHEPEEEANAIQLAGRLCALTCDDGSLIVNTFRPHSSTRILELFGKRFDYRDIGQLTALMSNTKFAHPVVFGSGLIYDLKVFRKQPRP